MDIDFDVNEVLRRRLAESLGLDYYARIMNSVNATNVATDRGFQKTFNAFYLVRRNETWRNIYYDLFYFQRLLTARSIQLQPLCLMSRSYKNQ